MVHAIAPRAPSAPHSSTPDLITLDKLLIAQPERPLTPALHIRLVETCRVFAQALPQWDCSLSAMHLRVEGRRLITRRGKSLAARVELYPLEAPTRWFALLAYEGADGRELKVQAHAENPLAALVQVLERAALGA